MAIVKHMIPMSIVKLMIKKYHSHSINDPLKLFYDSLFNDFFNQIDQINDSHQINDFFNQIGQINDQINLINDQINDQINDYDQIKDFLNQIDPINDQIKDQINKIKNQKNIRIQSSSASIKNHAGRNNTSLK